MSNRDIGIDLNPNPNGIYVSLVGPFIGYYAEVIGAKSRLHARIMCCQDRWMQRLWCNVYDFGQVSDHIGMYGGKILKIEPLDADQSWAGDSAYYEYHEERKRGQEERAKSSGR